MKKFKKFASTALALMLMLSMSVTAFAAPDDADQADTTPATGSMAVDADISVLALKPGDSVSFYQILEWKGAWVACDPFTSALSNSAAIEQLIRGDIGEDGTVSPEGGITSQMAADLGNLVDGATVYKGGAFVADDDGKVVIDGPDAGLYMAIITPAVAGYAYNPVFVAADFSRSNTSAITLDNGATAYADKAKAKLNVITVEKTASDVTLAAGEEVEFEISTLVPGYTKAYTDPQFVIKDTLSANLVLVSDSVVVKADETVLKDGTEYTLSTNGDDYSLAVSFAKDYLYGITGSANVTVSYKAMLDINEETATTSVTEENNQVKVEYSNNPSDKNSHGELEDRVNVYTFEIGGKLLGEESYEVTEIVKVGVTADGTEITETVHLDNGVNVGALQGATFKLCTEKNPDKVYENETGKYDNIVSDENGRMNIRGLDAGEYWLYEISAPAGYIAAQEPVHIMIDAKINANFEVKDDNDKVLYTTNMLESYTITIDGVETSYFEINNDGTGITSSSKGDMPAGDRDGFGRVKNTIGVELPSTGGIGTTIFYVVGAILVIGAGVLLVVKKRVGEQD